MTLYYKLSFIILATLHIFPQCFTQNCRYVQCGVAACRYPVSIPGRCCPVCPPSGNAQPSKKCPRADISLPCGESCGSDRDCAIGQKCCDHGCGRSCRGSVTVSSASCPNGLTKVSTECEKLSGIPCPKGYYCKHSLASGFSECCPTPEYAGYRTHPCEHAICAPVYCTHTRVPQGRCCPECVQQVHHSTAPATTQATRSFYQPNQPAVQQQVNYCANVRCPRITCMNPTRSADGCCQLCPRVPATPAPVLSAPAPGNSQMSMFGSMMCMFTFCQTVTCPNAYTPPGECCDVCPPDPCTNAVCPQLTCPNPIAKAGQCCPICPDPCANVACPQLACANGYRPEGQCCPTCPAVHTCYFNGKTYRQGEAFAHSCNNCTCSDGHILCSNSTCDQPCTYNGKVYNSGVTVYSSSCQTCNCNNGVIYCTQDICSVSTKTATRPPPQPVDPCGTVVCGKTTCPVTYQPSGECCPICLNAGECLYDGKMYINGAVQKEHCQKCTCMEGLMVCSNDCIPKTTTTIIKTAPMSYPAIHQPSPPRQTSTVNRPPPRQPTVVHHPSPPVIHKPPPRQLPQQTLPQRPPPRQPPPSPYKQVVDQQAPPPPAPKKPFKRGPPPRPPPPPGKAASVRVQPYRPPLLVQSSKDLHVPSKKHRKQQQPQPPRLDPYLQSPDIYVKPQPLPKQSPPTRYPPSTRSNNPPPQRERTPTPTSKIYQTFPEKPGRIPQSPPLQAFEQIPQNQLSYPGSQKGPSLGAFSGPFSRSLPRTRPPSKGRIISRNTGLKARDRICSTVHCPVPNCPDYAIPKGECCPICKATKKLTKKPGTCPPVRRAGLCVNLCKTDHDCDGPKICCYNGCGNQCFDPIINK